MRTTLLALCGVLFLLLVGCEIDTVSYTRPFVEVEPVQGPYIVSETIYADDEPPIEARYYPTDPGWEPGVYVYDGWVWSHGHRFHENEYREKFVQTNIQNNVYTNVTVNRMQVQSARKQDAARAAMASRSKVSRDGAVALVPDAVRHASDHALPKDDPSANRQALGLADGSRSHQPFQPGQNVDPGTPSKSPVPLIKKDSSRSVQTAPPKSKKKDKKTN